METQTIPGRYGTLQKITHSGRQKSLKFIIISVLFYTADNYISFYDFFILCLYMLRKEMEASLEYFIVRYYPKRIDRIEGT